MEGEHAEAGGRRRRKRRSRRKENPKPIGHSKGLQGGGGRRGKEERSGVQACQRGRGAATVLSTISDKSPWARSPEALLFSVSDGAQENERNLMDPSLDG